jgi:galactose mutarotase-like enzyme
MRSGRAMTAFQHPPSEMSRGDRQYVNCLDLTPMLLYRLAEGTLEVALKLNNLSAAPMPVAVGFHPYFQVNDAPRDEWTFSVGAKTH